MKTDTQLINPFQLNAVGTQTYEVIENEMLTNCNLNDLTISGSLFSLTTFRHVTFSSCVFFASKMENCTFIDCTFDRCIFQFSALAHCELTATRMVDCKWELTDIKKNYLNHCFLDRSSARAFGIETNNFEICISTEDYKEAA